jgi:hypothetical protein
VNRKEIPRKCLEHCTNREITRDAVLRGPDDGEGYHLRCYDGKNPATCSNSVDTKNPLTKHSILEFLADSSVFAQTIELVCLDKNIELRINFKHIENNKIAVNIGYHHEDV